MEHKHKRMAELVLKQLTGDISEEEIKELELIRTDLKINDNLFDELLNPSHLAAHFEFMDKFDAKASWKRVKTIYPLKREKASTRKYLQLAAAVICAFTILSRVLLDETKLVPDKTSSNSTACIADTIQYKSEPWNVKTTNKSNQCKPIEKQAPEKPTTKLAVTVKKRSLMKKARNLLRQPAHRAYEYVDAERKKNKNTATNHDTLSFEKTDLQTILRRSHPDINYEVVYTEEIQPTYFTGTIIRDSAVILTEQVLILYDLDYTVEGNKYIVYRK